MEWPGETVEPTKYFFCDLPADYSLCRLVQVAKARWKIEQDYQQLKRNLTSITMRAAVGASGIITCSSVGLLKASYRPEQEVCAVRSVLRHRESLVQMAATHVHHMQKALDQMNLQVHHVIMCWSNMASRCVW